MKVNLWLYAMIGVASATALSPRRAQLAPIKDYADDNVKDYANDNVKDYANDNVKDYANDNVKDYANDNVKDYADNNVKDYADNNVKDYADNNVKDYADDNSKGDKYAAPKDDHKPEPHKSSPYENVNTKPEEPYQPKPWKPEEPEHEKPEGYKPEHEKPKGYKPEPEYKDEYSSEYPTKDSEYPTKDGYGSEYPKDKYPKSWKPKSHHPEFFSLKVDEKCYPGANPADCHFDGFAIRLEKGIVIATPYNKWWDPKLPIFFVDDDTQAYTVSKRPLQLYIDAVTGALRYAPVGWLPPNSVAISFYKIGNNPLGKVGPSPAYFAWPSTEGRTNVGSAGTWWLCPLSGTGQYQVFISDANFGKSEQGGVSKTECEKQSLAAVNANPWRQSGY